METLPEFDAGIVSKLMAIAMAGRVQLAGEALDAILGFYRLFTLLREKPIEFENSFYALARYAPRGTQV
mgnify:CR=1 FL=1